MKRKLVILIYILFFNYLLICGIFFLSIPYFISWGSKKLWYLKFIMFAQEFPFSLTHFDGKIIISFIFLNALFWSLLISLAFYFSAKWMNKK